MKIETGIMSADDLVELIYRGESLPQDKRFLPSDKGGVFKYFDVKDIIGFSDKRNKLYFFIKQNNLIVGLSKLEKDPKNDNNFY